MKRFVLASLAVVCCWGGLNVRAAQAQSVFQRPQLTPFSRPTFSPYLNLARGGSNTVNYYGVIRPQQETTRSLQHLQQQLQLGQPAAPIAEDARATSFATGHQTHFANYGQYFPQPTGRPTAPAPTGLGRR